MCVYQDRRLAYKLVTFVYPFCCPSACPHLRWRPLQREASLILRATLPGCFCCAYTQTQKLREAQRLAQGAQLQAPLRTIDAALSPQAEEAGSPWQPRADRCPPPPRSLPPGACEVEPCQADAQCPKRQRCCYNGCAHACLEAVPPPPGRRSGLGKGGGGGGGGRGRGRGAQVDRPAVRPRGVGWGAQVGVPTGEGEGCGSLSQLPPGARSALPAGSSGAGNVRSGGNDASCGDGGDFSLKDWTTFPGPPSAGASCAHRWQGASSSPRTPPGPFQLTLPGPGRI